MVQTCSTRIGIAVAWKLRWAGWNKGVRRVRLPNGHYGFLGRVSWFRAVGEASPHRIEASDPFRNVLREESSNNRVHSCISTPRAEP